MISSAAIRLPREVEYPSARAVEDFDRDYLLDLAQAGSRDSWPLVGDRAHVEAICREFGAAADELQLEQERHADTRAELDTAADRLAEQMAENASLLARTAGLDAELAAQRQLARQFDLQLSTARGIGATFARAYRNERRAACDLTALLERALAAAMRAPSIAAAMATYAKVEEELRRDTLEIVERAESARLVIEADDGTTAHVVEIGGAL